MNARALVLVPVLAAALAVGDPVAAAPDDEGTVVHLLNRVGFGPRPGDVERVRTLGVQSYIEQQLRPDRIKDADVESRLKGLPTLGMNSREIAKKYELPLVEARRQRGQDQGAAAPPPPGTPPMADPVQQRANRVVVELSEQKILRAVYSERQLQEVLTDFWFNHFNVDARKGPTRFMLTEYEREAIRPHVLGKFRDLLDAVAKSPAMLFYLDNWMSTDPNGPHLPAPRARVMRGRFGPIVVPPLPPPAQNPNRPKGLNENYGRELLELHTLGVDGGYTQHDVTEVARAFTGWTIEQPRQGGGFHFNPRMHDPGEKIVLGHKLSGGRGIEDGEEVLDLVARHPSTARFIATKLARRFVSDDPPQALVDRAAARFRDTGGDLREVTRTILTSPEFLSPDARAAKVKTPFEFLVSALRASGANVEDAVPLVRAMQPLGMPLYQCQPPTGYKDTAEAWVNSGALVTRMNVAVRLVDNKLPGTFFPGTEAPVASVDVAVGRYLGRAVGDATRETIAKASTSAQIAALLLGSPEFQRR